MKQMKIFIDVKKQTLELYQLTMEEYANSKAYKHLQSIDINSNETLLNKTLLKSYLISTGKNGVGCQEGTGQTPLGKHTIAEKIGQDQPINSVYVGRVTTGEIYSDQLRENEPKRDWILSRILWLTGEQEGYNKGINEQGCCDTYQRYIYIHGTPDTEPMGIPMSHGCIRMRNSDVMELFELIEEGCEVMIT